MYRIVFVDVYVDVGQMSEDTVVRTWSVMRQKNKYKNYFFNL